MNDKSHASAGRPRLAALALLYAVLHDRQTLDSAMDEAPAFSALEGRDRAFARALASAVLRRLGVLDRVLTHFLARPLPNDAIEARLILRLGAAELLVLKAPPHAAVSQAVDLARSRRAAHGFANLTNAVLRRVAADGPALMEAAQPGEDLPDWLFTRWRAFYGGESAAAIAQALLREPSLDLTFRANDALQWAERLGGALLPTGGVRLAERTGAVADLPGYAEGAWWPQDAAASLPARLLRAKPGDHLLDLCAAPGGKTLQLAAAGAETTALDIAATRLRRLRHSLERTGLNACLVEADLLHWRPTAPFDGVLLDAPCSATGTLRRHPEAAWLRTPDSIREAAARQRVMLEAAEAFVRPGGVLVYSVCSLEPEEGPEQIAAALPAGIWRRLPVEPGELPAEFITPQGDLRTLPSHLPDQGGMDGFFAARLLRL